MLLIGFIVFRSPRQSPAISHAKMSYLAGSAVLRFEGQVWTALCRPVPSGALGSPPAGPCRGPGPLRTLAKVTRANVSSNTQGDWPMLGGLLSLVKRPDNGISPLYGTFLGGDIGLWARSSQIPLRGLWSVFPTGQSGRSFRKPRPVRPEPQKPTNA